MYQDFRNNIKLLYYRNKKCLLYTVIWWMNHRTSCFYWHFKDAVKASLNIVSAESGFCVIVHCVSFWPVLHKQLNQLISLMKSISLMNIKSHVWFCGTVSRYATAQKLAWTWRAVNQMMSSRWPVCQTLTCMRNAGQQLDHLIVFLNLLWLGYTPVRVRNGLNWIKPYSFIHISNIYVFRWYWRVFCIYCIIISYLIVSVYCKFILSTQTIHFSF